MENRLYRIRLPNGEELGPLGVDDVHDLVMADKVVGDEQAQLYPDGTWSDISLYRELADLILRRIEGTLEPRTPKTADQQAPDISSEPQKVFDINPSKEIELPTASTAEPAVKVKPDAATIVMEPSLAPNSATTSDGEATVVGVPIDSQDDKTIISKTDYSTDQSQPEALDAKMIVIREDGAAELKTFDVPQGALQVQVSAPSPSDLSNEKTAMLDLSAGAPADKDQSKPSANTKFKHRMKLVLIAAAAIVILAVLFPEVNKPEPRPEFKIEMPTAAQVTDAQKADGEYNVALKTYYDDTVDGYQKAARHFLKAASLDPNNPRALAMLASCYINLFDSVTRDEQYFTVITRLIELSRAKNIDILELVIADVELYLLLGNPEAAQNRIIEFSKKTTDKKTDNDLFLFLAQTVFQRRQYKEAADYLVSISPQSLFGARINMLLGRLHEANNSFELAAKAYQAVVDRSPKHARARTKLAELNFKMNDLKAAAKHVRFIIENEWLASRPELAKALYLRGRINLVDKKLPEALGDLKQALKLDPQNREVRLEYYSARAKEGDSVKEAQGEAKMFHYLAAGELALQNNNIDQALKEFISAREAKIDSVTPLLRLAEVYQKKNDLQAAKSSLAKAVELQPKDAETYPIYIRVLIEGFEFDEAKRAIETFKTLEPAVAIIDRLQADLLFKQGKLTEANAFYKRALGSAEIDSSIYNKYAEVMFQSNQYRDAAFFHGLALRFDPYNTEAILGVGKALSEMETVDKGVDYVQAAIEQSPNKTVLIGGIGEIYLRKGDYEKALRYANNALNLDAEYAFAHKIKGAALVGQDKFKDALEEYRIYQTRMPLDPTGYVDRYRLMIKKLDLRGARDEMEKLIDIYPKFPGAYYYLGEAYKEGQNFDAAQKAAETEIQNNPGFIPAYVLAGASLNMKEKYSDALVLLTRGLSLNPNYVPTLVQAAIANHRLKTYAAAQSMLERAVEIDPGNPSVHKHLGFVYRDLGNLEKSKYHLKAYLDLLPDAPDRAEILRRMNE